MSKDELIKRIQQCEDVIEKQDAIILRLNADIQKDKNGYLYIAQFEIEKERYIYKMGKPKTSGFKNRICLYFSTYGKERYELNILRCAHDRDVLIEEDVMHMHTRELCKTVKQSKKRES